MAAPLQKNGFSPSIRFLGILKQPYSDPPNPISHHLLELDESDVVWSSSSTDFPSPVDALAPNSPVSSSASTDHSPSGNHRFHDHRDGGHRRRPFTPEKFGLSAALAEEPGPLVQQRKPSLDPSLSAASSARTVPPVPLPRSGSEDLSAGSGKLFHESAPVNVPVWARKGMGREGTKLDEMEEWVVEWEGEEEEVLPPHLIVARSHVSTFSVFEGVGRTLKGRDLRRVRNAVFRKTGFLD